MSMSFKEFHTKHLSMLDFETVTLDEPTEKGTSSVEAIYASEGHLMLFGGDVVDFIAHDPDSTDGKAAIVYFQNQDEEEIHTEYSIDEDEAFDVLSEIIFYKEVEGE